MLLLFIFCVSSVLGTVSKTLLMSITARSVRCAGFGAFRLSCMCCVSVVRSVVVKCLAVKPCWVGERGMSVACPLSRRMDGVDVRVQNRLRYKNDL